ncbi:MAG: ATP phosphoribosyltransferase regulatory subunit [Clostridiales bacterium]|jgi:ATP phosphoribosyltransferase regulatory subunit|nr:ATP phosphoribosyltransferase regulatory subunit [Clostridiales bacterium]
MMKDNKRHTPDGFKDSLPGPYQFKLKLKQKIENTFYLAGYSPISSPMLEYAEVFEGAGSAPPRQMYRLIDREGDVLTLRSDMTPPVARIAATNYTPADLPLRFYYTENAFRCHQSYKGKAGEFTESGVELLGGGAEADAEVIALAVNCLRAAGLTEFRVYMGHAGFFRGALEESGMAEEDKAAALRHIAGHNIVAAEALLRGKKLSYGLIKLTERLNMLTGDAGILDEAGGLVHNETSALAVSALREIYDALTDYGLTEYILFDLGMTGTLDYYTGAVFRVYARGTGFSLLDGGRYDNLVKQYGQDFPAVGFSLKLDNLAAILDGGEPLSGGALIAYTRAGRKEAFLKAAELRAEGIRTENSLTVGAPREYYEAEARARGIERVYYFEGGDAWGI